MPEQIPVVEDEPSIADNIVYALSTEGSEEKLEVQPLSRGAGWR